jgi:hypothetical protein
MDESRWSERSPDCCWELDSAPMHFRSKSQEQISGVK